MHGIGVSPGISIGTAYVIRKSLTTISGIVIEDAEIRRDEIARFEYAVRDSVREIELISENKKNILQKSEIDILETQIEFLSDPQIKTDVLEKIYNEFKTAADAVIEVIDAAVKVFENIDDEYLSARAADIKDIGNRILKNLDAAPGPDYTSLAENTIIITEELAPSDTISFDISRIAGIATKAGGWTSHTAIIAKSRGIPAVVACGDTLMEARNNDVVLLDGSSGEVIIKPDEDAIKSFRIKQEKYTEEMALLTMLKDLPAMTSDGRKINLFANISGADDLEKVFENGGEGVGLLRTELLFMNRNSFPGEEEQFIFYRDAALKSENRPVIIRTLDIGGDKQLPYLNIPLENNPFMGYRAIRFCLGNKDIFLTQIKAILRASAFGNVKIMFPMISALSEIKQAKECVQEAKEELLRSDIEFSKEIEIGIMIEIPGAALLADQLAGEVDFFSIGTNDLCQYTLAVDRMNEKVASLYNHFNPAILRLIRYTIEQARKHKIHVGLCGEMAADPLATLLLLGMGLEDFSMGAASIPVIKNIIRQTDISKAVDVFNRVNEMNNPEEIMEYLKMISV